MRCTISVQYASRVYTLPGSMSGILYDVNSLSTGTRVALVPGGVVIAEEERK